uniref:FBA_2 domain-containing protein n=1 Tax=Steinernema glaseri TaxID=37863 RepID=A0A1I7Z0J9_9BILA
MDTVPCTFIESVFVRCGYSLTDQVEKLTGRWRKLVETYVKKCGSLELSYAPYDEKEWRLHYQLHGWPHIKTRTLTKEVVKEMSRNITVIFVNLMDSLEHPDGSFDPNNRDDDAVLQLLTGLGAPKRRIFLNGDEDSYGTEALKYAEMVSRYKCFLRPFQAVQMYFFDNLWVHCLVNDMVSHGKVVHIIIMNPVSEISSRFWDDFFLSKTSRSFCGDFEHFDDILAIIRQWRNADPLHLVPHKLFKGIGSQTEKTRVEDFVDVGMTPVPVESVGAELFERIRREITRKDPSISLYRIDHLVDPSRKAYIVFEERYSYCFILFE